MSKRHVFQRVIQKTSYDLPATMNREIGRIVVRWTYLEHYIQRMIWAIAFDGDEHGASLGRIAIREPSSKESRLDLLEWVAEVRGIKLDKPLLKSIKTRSKSISDDRNLVAHGLWTNIEGVGWAAQQTRGAWQEFKDGPRGSKRIVPQAVPIDASRLKEIVSQIEKMIADTKTLKGSIGEA
jgi:hypothetical protein